MLVGLVLGLFIRWWAIPVAAVVWSLIVAVAVDTHDWWGGLLLGAANAFVCVVIALLVRRLVPATPAADAGADRPSER